MLGSNVCVVFQEFEHCLKLYSVAGRA